METAKEQFSDSRPDWESLRALQELEKAGYSRLKVLMEENRYGEAGQVLDILGKVGII